MTGSRTDYEAAIGAVIARFNDVEVALIDLICGLIRSQQKGEAVGWTIGFREKVKVVAALAKIDGLEQEWLDRLFPALKKAQELSDSVRNQVAHMEVWENPFDDSIRLRKGSVSPKTGYAPKHIRWTAEQLSAKAAEISAVADDLRSITARFDFGLSGDAK